MPKVMKPVFPLPLVLVNSYTIFKTLLSGHHL